MPFLASGPVANLIQIHKSSFTATSKSAGGSDRQWKKPSFGHGKIFHSHRFRPRLREYPVIFKKSYV